MDNVIYIVEMHCYDGYMRYGIYSNIEKAKEKLQKLFIIQSKYSFKDKNTEMKYEWISDKLFVLKVIRNNNENIHEEFKITKEIIL